MAVSTSAMTGAQPNEQPDSEQSRRAKEWEWLGIRLLVFSTVLIVYGFGGSPIPSGGHDQRDNAKSFVQELYPDRATSPLNNSTEYLAVVFALIRSGANADARRAIDFAADNQFGNASPYVIERLESEDGELRQSAHAFLVHIAETDYGPSAAAWRA